MARRHHDATRPECTAARTASVEDAHNCGIAEGGGAADDRVRGCGSNDARAGGYQRNDRCTNRVASFGPHDAKAMRLVITHR